MGRMRSAAGLAALVLAAAVAAAGCGSAVGVVDTQRVLNESVKALQYQKQLDDREKQMAAELAVLAPQVSKAELAARRARLLTELGQMKADLEAKLNRQIMDAASEVARREGLRLDELARQVGGRVVGDPARDVRRVAPPDEAAPDAVVVVLDPSLLPRLEGRAGAVILAEDAPEIGR